MVMQLGCYVGVYVGYVLGGVKFKVKGKLFDFFEKVIVKYEYGKVGGSEKQFKFDKQNGCL